MSRLIDADALYESILTAEMGKVYKFCFPCKEIQQAIDEQPTIEERKKGKWEMKPDPYGFFEEIPVCSECGCTTEMRKTYNFCPNCGADMRGEGNGNE